jgi:hypothetical protein
MIKIQTRIVLCSFNPESFLRAMYQPHSGTKRRILIIPATGKLQDKTHQAKPNILIISRRLFQKLFACGASKSRASRFNATALPGKVAE